MWSIESPVLVCLHPSILEDLQIYINSKLDKYFNMFMRLKQHAYPGNIVMCFHPSHIMDEVTCMILILGLFL